MSKPLYPLLTRLAALPGSALWIADEHNLSALEALASHKERLLLLSNRYDVAETARGLGIAAHFSDFNFDFLRDLPEHQKPQHAFYRVSKERPVVNHIINSTANLLPQGGKLWISGQKNEGIKNYFGQAAKLYGSASKLHKEGDVYWGALEKTGAQGAHLDDRNYTQIRTIDIAGELDFLSKPGTYGWDKVDKGSAFLMSHVRPQLAEMETSRLRLLDLGCGYGYLTLQCQDFSFASMTATDNNAAALQCMQANADALDLPVEVVASDCGDTLAGPFELILCNPPFHQGFNVDSSLTDKFLTSTKRLLAKSGVAYFVVNAFIPLETKAAHFFGGSASGAVSVLANNKQFKVIRIEN